MLIVFLGGILSFHLAEGKLHLLFHVLLLGGTVWILLYWNSLRYTITNHKIIIEKGILTIDRNTFLFRNIEYVKLHKNVFGRLCWFGTIEMYAPTLQEVVSLYNIAEARRYFKLIQKSISEHRRTRLVYPSSRVMHGLEKQKRDMKVA